MGDVLTLRRLEGGHAFVAIYEHPTLGNIDVGRIAERVGISHDADPWAWAVRVAALAPVYSTDDSRIPPAQRTWITRQNVSFEGTAKTFDEAIDAWKACWPTFRDARTEDEWRAAQESENQSRRQNMRWTLHRMGGISPELRAQALSELGQPGPPADWVVDLVEKRRR